jgi:large subunit ribosomal protein L33
MPREIITLACAACKSRNYNSTKNPKAAGGGQPKKLELKKFCSGCGKHTVHKEAR